MEKLVKSCPMCGAQVPLGSTCLDQYYALSEYTLALRDPEFIHQHAVDAYAASHASEKTKLATVAGLIGLYVFAELGYTGKQAQLAHTFLGNQMKQWPEFLPPPEKATITVTDVLKVTPGAMRNEKIRQWAKAVWKTWQNDHKRIGKRLLDDFPLGIRTKALRLKK